MEKEGGRGSKNELFVCRGSDSILSRSKFGKFGNTQSVKKAIPLQLFQNCWFILPSYTVKFCPLQKWTKNGPKTGVF